MARIQAEEGRGAVRVCSHTAAGMAQDKARCHWIRRLGWPAALIALVVIASAAPTFPAMADELADLQKEATQLNAEKQQLEQKLQQNLTVKRDNERKIEALSGEDNRVAALGRQIDIERPAVAAKCNRTVPHGELAAAEAACDSVLVPFNNRVHDYNDSWAKLDAQHAAIHQSEVTRVSEAKALLSRNEAIDTRLAFIQKRLNLLQNAKLQCSLRCGGSTDAAAQCMQECWDAAASGRAPVETTPEYQKQIGRTPEQAIEEYKKSGAPQPGPNTLKTTPVPPPSR